MIDPSLARSIKIVGIDVDGVLTDGGIYLGAVDGHALEFKRYDIHDGLGLYLMRQAGLTLAVITGRVSESVRLRCAELGIDDVVQDPRVMKLAAFDEILARRGLSRAEAAFLGDDFPDMAVLRSVALPVAVGNAVAEVRDVCRVQLSRSGGRGAVREFAELLLRARGDWDSHWQRYVAERARSPEHAAR